MRRILNGHPSPYDEPRYSARVYYFREKTHIYIYIYTHYILGSMSIHRWHPYCYGVILKWHKISHLLLSVVFPRVSESPLLVTHVYEASGAPLKFCLQPHVAAMGRATGVDRLLPVASGWRWGRRPAHPSTWYQLSVGSQRRPAMGLLSASSSCDHIVLQNSECLPAYFHQSMVFYFGTKEDHEFHRSLVLFEFSSDIARKIMSSCSGLFS